ncbi:MAG: SPOR domain-containing protein [Caulobacteraceae bacterium]|nr:SPOR domain-containing protein [Caulobacteraceae bacterium]
MTDQDRGAYTPQTDAPLAFDARYARGAGERPLPMTLIVSGVILVLLVGALAFFYRSGVRGLGQAPQVVGTPVAEAKAPPSDASAGTDSAAGLQVYRAEAVPAGEGHAPTAAVLAPPPETPAPRPAPVVPVDQAALRPVLPEAPAAAAPSPAAPVAAAPTPVKLAKAEVAPLARRPAASPEPRADEADAAVGDTAKVKTAKVAATKPVTPKPLAAEPAAGTPVVQIGAFSSQALAQKGWGDVAAVMPSQMAGKSRKVEMASSGGKTFYRTFVGGFATRAAADSFCASLKAAGRACMVK